MMTDGATLLADDVLDDVQGLVATGYGHLGHTAYLFVGTHDVAAARRWIARLAGSITTAARWPTGADGRTVKPSEAVNVAFTASGLSACGLAPEAQHTFPPEFREGVAIPHRSRILGDTEESAPEHWEFGGPASPPVHALVIVNAASAAALGSGVAAQQRLIDESAGRVVELRGSPQHGYRPAGDREPFGFHDGIAQPPIAGIAGSGVPTGEFLLGYDNHFRSIPPGPVVPAALDPAGMLPPLHNPHHAANGLRDFGRNGSYLVYRKLAQDVAGFWRFMRQEAIRVLGRPDPAFMVETAAKCVGRWPSGAPLALAPYADDPGKSGRDDFGYRDDPHGLACPIGAHVRRANPRDAIRPYAARESLSMSEAHRLLRRGRAYGPPLVDPLRLDRGAASDAWQDVHDDGRARGTHFVCLCASIRSQFEFVQQSWCNNPRFGGLHGNTDPIAGDAGRSGESPSRMTLPGRRPVRTAPLPRFVTVKAAAYCFMPSLTALRFLAGKS